MFVEFESMPDNSRVWMYQSNRKLDEVESEELYRFLRNSIGNWVTHGMPMKGSFRLLHNRILLIAADQDFQSPSGCSIDSSTRWLKELGSSLNVDFFDRSIGYLIDGELQFMAFFDAKKNIQSGLIQPDTKIINSQITNKLDAVNNLTIPASESFLKRHFETDKVS